MFHLRIITISKYNERRTACTALGKEFFLETLDEVATLWRPCIQKLFKIKPKWFQENHFSCNYHLYSTCDKILIASIVTMITFNYFICFSIRQQFPFIIALMAISPESFFFLLSNEINTRFSCLYYYYCLKLRHQSNQKMFKCIKRFSWNWILKFLTIWYCWCNVWKHSVNY